VLEGTVPESLQLTVRSHKEFEQQLCQRGPIMTVAVGVAERGSGASGPMRYSTISFRSANAVAGIVNLSSFIRA